MTVTFEELDKAGISPSQATAIGLRVDYAALVASAPPGWVSVKDRLPDKEGDCLVYTWEVQTEYAEPDGASTYFENSAVTHWMPLPAPPTKEPQ